uniref:Uncharacterized protein n=1 Tax=Callorhinchus milii TaxID=7868 RepID=A0A4W3K0K4_CALMI
MLALICGVSQSSNLFDTIWHISSRLDSPVVFIVFKRCTIYPIHEETRMKNRRMVEQSKSYPSFSKIPILVWMLFSVVLGFKCRLLELIPLMALEGCCLPKLLSRLAGRFSGVIRFLGGYLIGSECALAPFAWGSKAIRQSTNNQSDQFFLGTCTLGW